MLSKEQLGVLHPILSIPEVQILFCDHVLKLNTHNKLQNRILVISSAGMFLLENKSFPKSTSLSRVISFTDLFKLTVDDHNLKIEGTTAEMTIQHKEHTHIASIIYFVQQTLFPERKLIFQMSDPIRRQIESNVFIFETNSIIGDRFLSFCLGVSDNYTLEQVNQFYDKLKDSPSGVTLNGKHAMSPLINAFCQSIASCSTVTSLHFEALNFSSIIPRITPILKESTSITQLLFTDVSFIGVFDLFFDTFTSGCLIPITEMIFSECALDALDYIQFIRTTAIFTHEINELSFIRCSFSTDTFMETLQAVFTSPCFGRLRKLRYISPKMSSPPIEAVSILFSCSWMIEDQCLRYAAITNCNLDLSELLPQILQFENGIVCLDLSGNRFSSALSTNQSGSFHDIDELILKDTCFEGDTFESLLKVLAAADPSPSRLDLSGSKIEGRDIYRALGRIYLPEVASLSWRGISVPSQRIQAFIDFLMSLPALAELDISCCISPEDMFRYAHQIGTFVREKRLRKLVLSGGAAGEGIAGLIAELGACADLVALDVSGQEIGDDGLEALEAMVPRLEELYFDGSGAKSGERLESFCRSVLSSGIERTRFPESDAKRVVARAPFVARADTLKSVERLREEFKRKYGEPREESDTSRRLRKIVRSSSRRGEALLAELPVDPELDRLLRMCVAGDIRNVLLDCFTEAISIRAIEVK